MVSLKLNPAFKLMSFSLFSTLFAVFQAQATPAFECKGGIVRKTHVQGVLQTQFKKFTVMVACPVTKNTWGNSIDEEKCKEDIWYKLRESDDAKTAWVKALKEAGMPNAEDLAKLQPFELVNKLFSNETLTLHLDKKSSINLTSKGFETLEPLDHAYPPSLFDEGFKKSFGGGLTEDHSRIYAFGSVIPVHTTAYESKLMPSYEGSTIWYSVVTFPNSSPKVVVTEIPEKSILNAFNNGVSKTFDLNQAIQIPFHQTKHFGGLTIDLNSNFNLICRIKGTGAKPNAKTPRVNIDVKALTQPHPAFEEQSDPALFSTEPAKP